MKILGTEKQKHADCLFSVNVVDSIDANYTTLVKKSFFSNSEAYKKRTFTNGKFEKVFVENTDAQCKVKFKVIDGDWLLIVDEQGNITMYITEQYVGPIETKNKAVQKVLEEHYEYCRNRIESKRDFAKEMGAISRRLNLPFQIVMALKGNEKLLNALTKNIEEAISDHLYEDRELMLKLASNNTETRMSAIESFGITKVPEYQTEKIAKYLHDCLSGRRVVRRFE